MASPYTATGNQNNTTSGTSGIKEQVHDQFDKLADKATRTLHDAAGQAEHFASRAADEARVVGGNVQEVAGNIQGAVTKSVKDQPMVTLAMVAVAGFVLGALWKS